MNVLIMIITVSIVLGILVFIHEGGHYLAARAFGVRVTEFMLGLPGPSLSFTRGETKFGITAIPLGGYARVCGMEPGEMSPYLKQVLTCIYRRGSASGDMIARDCGISIDDAIGALEELSVWGTIVAPKRRGDFALYKTAEIRPTKKDRIRGLQHNVYALHLPAGTPRLIDNIDRFFDLEYSKQYRSLPFWKRSIILLAGIFVNLLFAVLAFVLVYSILGFDYPNPDTGELMHIVLTPFQAIKAGFIYIGVIFVTVIKLFNPYTAAQVVSESTSVMGIAVMSKSAAEAGFASFLIFTAMISVSLGIMNLLPIPPLDGGRFVIEIYQKIRRRIVSPRVMNVMSLAGIAFFFIFFIFMMNQDIQRFVFGNWG